MLYPISDSTEPQAQRTTRKPADTAALRDFELDSCDLEGVKRSRISAPV